MTYPSGRREFMLSMLASASRGAAPSGWLAGCQTNAWPIGGLPQFLDVLERIRKLGYAGFETSYRNLQAHFLHPAEVKARIASTGLRFLGIHIFLTEYDGHTGLAPREMIERVAAGGAALGAERLILSGKGEGAPGKAEALGAAAVLCRKLGLRLAYHNHDVEFRRGAAEIESLLAGTDPAAVKLIFDAGHASVAGADAARFLERHHARIDGIHLRDFKDGRQVPLGQGAFDLRGLAAAARRAGWRGWLINEEERPNDVRPGEAVVEPARRHMRKIFGV